MISALSLVFNVPLLSLHTVPSVPVSTELSLCFRIILVICFLVFIHVILFQLTYFVVRFVIHLASCCLARPRHHNFASSFAFVRFYLWKGQVSNHSFEFLKQSRVAVPGHHCSRLLSFKDKTRRMNRDVSKARFQSGILPIGEMRCLSHLTALESRCTVCALLQWSSHMYTLRNSLKELFTTSMQGLTSLLMEQMEHFLS